MQDVFASRFVQRAISFLGHLFGLFELAGGDEPARSLDVGAGGAAIQAIMRRSLFSLSDALFGRFCVSQG